ncbi:hypothetical protein B5X24_HaOG213580 [Helicoverpa armigera]|uniref:Endonuclease-reverse transcriptase n=1 Tax=Helicoverpa armigera TaxID=29058 RepID=A0A2W1B975_HELAM|nr:hypothetical protein B5X24_HaOG213580 [Helicoverpa armigera]
MPFFYRPTAGHRPPLTWRSTKLIEVDKIKRRKWNWIGHTLRRYPDHIPRQALDWNPQGKRKRGRPKQSWRRTIIAEAATMGRTWSEIKREAQDRTRWRSTVDALCPI